jgi:hypothetical protein
MKALFVPVSANAKTGPIPATITERGSCWSGCALYGKGCYALYGALGHSWAGVSDGTRGGSWDELCAKVAALPKRTLWRYAQAGDLPGADDAIDTELLWQLVVSNRGKKVIAFTHKPVLADTSVAHRKRCTIAVANAVGFTINLSANNLAEADALAALGIGPVVTVLAHEYARRAVRHRAKPGPTNGRKRSPNGAAAPPRCRDIRPRAGALRSARRPTPPPPANHAAPVPSPARP